MRIVYKDKRHSSGMIKQGEMVLYISSRLPREVQRQHIEELVRKLQDRLQRHEGLMTDPPFDLTPSGISDDAALTERANYWNDRFYRFGMHKVCFRRQESRWGSCSLLTRNIYISHRLRNGPLALLDYVLIHEICHLKGLRPPHGPGFWKLVSVACPDYKEQRKRLHAYGLWLDRSGSD